jgi:hypothetical protein
MKIEGQVGPQVVSDGSFSEIRLGRTAEQVVNELHGRYFEQTYRKNLYTAYAAAVATSLVGTAMVGLQVWNGSPVSNGVNLVLLKVGGMIVVTSASTTSLVLATGTGQVSAPTSQTAITRVTNNFIGGPAPQATAMNAGTFTNAPTAMMNLMHNTAAIATTGEDTGFFVDLEGSVIIPPQCYVAIAAVGAAVAASGSNLHLMWEEVAV